MTFGRPLALAPDFGRLGFEDLDLDPNTPLSAAPPLPPGLAYLIDNDGNVIRDEAGDYVVVPA